MALADRLKRTLSEIGEMDLDELALWAAWLKSGGGDAAETRADWRAARIQSTIANSAMVWRNTTTAKDFMPDEHKQIDPTDAEQRLMRWCASMGQVKEGR